jgi:hypothetical protein
MITRTFWRTDGTYPSKTAATRRARAIRWHPFIIERGLAVRVSPLADGRYAVEVGANDARLLAR